jgi:isopenicillin N synthase-like dioxygenase
MGSNQWPNEPSGFRPLIEEYVNVMTDLGEAIIQGIALALSGKKDAFGGKRAGDPFWILRVIGYPPMKKSDFEVGCGDHTDYGLLTLVNQDPTIPALQVKNNEGNWIWAKPIPGTFVVNIGDMLKIWTNGLYQSTLHRVMNDDSKYRVSVPFFYEPNFDALVEPLEICEQQTGSAVPRFTPVVYGDHVIGKVLTNFG